MQRLRSTIDTRKWSVSIARMEKRYRVSCVAVIRTYVQYVDVTAAASDNVSLSSSIAGSLIPIVMGLMRRWNIGDRHASAVLTRVVT